MLKINILAVGKLKEKYLKDGIEEYKKRLTKVMNVTLIELDEGNPSATIENIVADESARITAAAKGYICLLDLEGKELTSEELSQKIFGLTVSGVSEITFIIGGSYGVSGALKERADFRLCFGKMTFPHQLMRLVLIEQIYRAHTININSPYHK